MCAHQLFFFSKKTLLKPRVSLIFFSGDSGKEVVKSGLVNYIESHKYERRRTLWTPHCSRYSQNKWKIFHMVLSDLRLKVREILNDDLGVKKHFARWVQRSLTIDTNVIVWQRRTSAWAQQQSSQVFAVFLNRKRNVDSPQHTGSPSRNYEIISL